MYPRVKVRGAEEDEEEEQEQEEPITPQENGALLFINTFESLSIENYCPPKDEDHHVSVPIAKVRKSYVPNVQMHSVAALKDSTAQSTGAIKKENDEKSGTNIRASSVPMPRAVLSSPNNDEMIGSRNRLLGERRQVSRPQDRVQNTLAQGKQVLKSINADSPKSTKRVSKEANTKAHSKGTPTTELTVPKRKPNIRKANARTLEL